MQGYCESGDLRPVWVPDERKEALRDLLRAREDACQDLLRLPEGVRAWTQKHPTWLESIHSEEAAQQVVLSECIHAVDEAKSRIERFKQQIALCTEAFADQRVIKALQALRAVELITAATLVAELGDITRFENAKQLVMSCASVVPSEYWSGARERRGLITKTGNAHIRRVIVQSAWNYRHNPKVGVALKERHEGLPEEIKAISWKAQVRLNRKYKRMLGRGRRNRLRC